MTMQNWGDRPWRRELPVKTDQDPELKQVLQKTADEIRRVESQEKVLSMDNIFLGCLNGQLEVDTELNRMTKERYGFTVEEPVEMFAVWLGESYDQQETGLRRRWNIWHKMRLDTGRSCRKMKMQQWCC